MRGTLEFNLRDYRIKCDDMRSHFEVKAFKNGNLCALGKLDKNEFALWESLESKLIEIIDKCDGIYGSRINDEYYASRKIAWRDFDAAELSKDGITDYIIDSMGDYSEENKKAVEAFVNLHAADIAEDLDSAAAEVYQSYFEKFTWTHEPGDCKNEQT